MDSVTEQLIVKVSTDLNDLKAGMSQMKMSVNNAAKSSSTAFADLTKTVIKLYAAYRAVQGVWRSLNESVGRLDNLSKMSSILGISVETLNSFQYAGKLAGLTTQQTVVALRFLTKSVGEASQGLGEARVAFAALGLSVKNLVQLSPDEQFYRISDALSKITNPTQQAAVAVKIFGEQGQRVINLLRNGRRQIANAREELRKFGSVTDGPDVSRMVALRDATTRLETAWQALKDKLVVTFAPAIVKAFEGVAAALGKVQEKTSSISKDLAEAIYGVQEGREAGSPYGRNLPQGSADRAALVDRLKYHGHTRKQAEAMAARLNARMGAGGVPTAPTPSNAAPVAAATGSNELGFKKLAEQYLGFAPGLVDNPALREAVAASESRMGLPESDEVKAIKERLASRFAVIEEFYADKEALVEEKLAAEVDAARKAQREITNIQREENLKRRMMYIDNANFIIGSLQGIVASAQMGAEEQFEATKLLNIAETITNTAAAVMKYHAMGRPGMATTAGILGAVQVAAIRNTTYEGGGTTAPATVATAAESAQAASPAGPIFNVTLSGQLGATNVRDLLEMIRDEGGDGARIGDVVVRG